MFSPQRAHPFPKTMINMKPATDEKPKTHQNQKTENENKQDKTKQELEATNFNASQVHEIRRKADQQTEQAPG